jgi:hypothetical protein
MNITINDILKREPCAEGIEELYALVGASYDKDKYLDIDLLVSKLSFENICWGLGELHKKEILVKLAIFSAEQVLHIYESSYDSTAPRLAIEAAKAYIKEPTAANRRACRKAARAASAAARAAAARSAARAAHAAASASYSTTQYAASHSAASAVRAASATYVASDTYGASYAVTNATANTNTARYAYSSSKDVETKIREYILSLIEGE